MHITDSKRERDREDWFSSILLLLAIAIVCVLLVVWNGWLTFQISFCFHSLVRIDGRKKKVGNFTGSNYAARFLCDVNGWVNTHFDISRWIREGARWQGNFPSSLFFVIFIWKNFSTLFFLFYFICFVSKKALITRATSRTPPVSYVYYFSHFFSNSSCRSFTFYDAKLDFHFHFPFSLYHAL